MDDRVVINTGPLITLARINGLDIAGRLAVRFVCPAQVQAELAAGAEHGYPPIEPSWLQVVPLEEAPSPLVLSALDAGEAAVIHPPGAEDPACLHR